jgi:membrane protein required for colicin V production
LNYIDITILIFLAIGFLLGYKDGLIRKIIGLAGLIIAIFMAFQFSQSAGEYLTPLLNQDRHLANITSGILIFIAIIVLTALIKRLIHPSDKVNKFLNQLLGGIAGTLQMLFFISGFLLFVSIFDLPSEEERKESFTYYPVYGLIPRTVDMFLGSESSAQEFLFNIIEEKDELEIPDIPE